MLYHDIQAYMVFDEYHNASRIQPCHVGCRIDGMMGEGERAMIRSHPSRMTNAPCVSGLRRSLRQTRWRRRPSQTATLHWFDLKHMAGMAIAGATVSARLVDELFIQQKEKHRPQDLQYAPRARAAMCIIVRRMRL